MPHVAIIGAGITGVTTAYNLLERGFSVTVVDSADFQVAIAGGKANSKIKGPDSLEHRYYKEDFGHGLLPFLEIANIAGVDTPVARSLYLLAQTTVGVDYRAGGRTAAAMGIAGLSKDQLLEKVSER